MADTLTARQFQDTEGTRDWRVLEHGATAVFRTGSLREGAVLVERIGAIADRANHHPDLDLRPRAVAARTLSHDVKALTGRDVGLARAISEEARRLGLAADPAAAQEIDLTIDALDIGGVVPFWAAALGHDRVSDDTLADPHGRWPSVWFQQMDAPRPLRNRIHIDTFWPRGLGPVRRSQALRAGGQVASEAFAPNWWTLADPEGNEVDVNDWEGFPYSPAAPLLTPDAFYAAEGVEDWSVTQGASTYVPTGGLAGGVALAVEAAALADEAGLPLYADLRYPGTTLRVGPPEDGWITETGLGLCRRIQAAARRQGLAAEPLAVRDLHLVIDALDIPAVQRFWAAALGYAERGEEDLFDPLMRGPALVFQQLDEPREQRNRIHLDVTVPDDLARERIDAALAAGGRMVTDAHAPAWWTLADPEGNEVDIAVRPEPAS